MNYKVIKNRIENIFINDLRVFNKLDHKKDKYKYYSQFHQDKWIIENVFSEMKNGYFLEIGAFDGIINSNTLTLERELDWFGLCVEAKDDNYDKLILNRKSKCVKHAIWSDNTKKLFLNRGGKSGLKESYDIDSIKNVEIAYQEIQTITIGELLEKYRAPKVIHYFSLDVEGAEYEILKTFPFESHVILALTVEHNAISNSKINVENKYKIRDLLYKNGFSLNTKISVEDWFINKNISDYIK